MLGRDLDTHMHVIRHHVAFQNAAFLLAGQLVKDGPQGFANVAKQGFPSSLRDKDNVILAIPTRMRQALIGVRHGFSFGVLSSSHRGRTLLPDRSKLCASHCSNQCITSITESDPPGKAGGLMSGAASKAVGPYECHWPVTSSKTVLGRLPAPGREYMRALAPTQNQPSRRHTREPRSAHR